MRICLLLTITFYPITFVYAEIITDGTLGNSVNLLGPHFQVEANLGQQYGGNLFYSFQSFNLNNHESATFSGPTNISNIISRITGGHPSSIDGLIRSTIPNADLYLLNPYGILFGPNAKLDVLGGFHASTADYLRLQDGGRFETRYPNNSLLTVAPVEAFGFLTHSPAPITTQSSKLSVSSDRTFSFIGGDLQITSETPLAADNSQTTPIIVSESILAAGHGRINLASLASLGEVIVNEDDLVLHGQGGKITVENTLIELSDYSGGATFVRAGQLVLSNAIIYSGTSGTQDGKDLNFKVTESIRLNGINSEISVTTASENDAGSILMDTSYLEMNQANIFTGSLAKGKAGPINIHADRVVLNEGASIGSGALGEGQSGNIVLNVAHSLSILGFYRGFMFFRGQPFENIPSRVFSISLGTGRSGNILLDTQELNVNVGNIFADGYGAGGSGQITINAQSARLVEGAAISSTTYHTAAAGNIKIRVNDQLHLAGWIPVTSSAIGRDWGILPTMIDSSTFGTGEGGTIDIQANEVILTEGGTVSAGSFGTGKAGEIVINANKIQLTNGGSVDTSAEYAEGGNIVLEPLSLLYLRGGQITTSVVGGTGDGGNITVKNSQFVVLNQVQIKAQADAGHGGNILIIAEQFIPSADSLISASSQKGISGEVIIQSPENNISNNLVVLETKSLNVDQTKTLCSKRRMNQQNRFIVMPLTSKLPSPEDDWRGSPIQR